MLALNQYRVGTCLSYTDANEIPNFLQLSRCTRADLSQRDTESLGLNLLSQSQSEQSQCSPACCYFTHSGKIDLVQFSPKNFQLLILTAVLAAAMKTLFSTLANSPITKHLCGEEQNILITSCGTSKSWLENIVCIVSNIVCNIPTFYFSLPSLILTEKSGFWHASHK